MGKNKNRHNGQQSENRTIQEKELPGQEKGRDREVSQGRKTEKKYRTPSGFEYTLKAENLQDMRLMDALVSMEDTTLTEAERVTSMVRVIQLLLGFDQKEALYAHVVRNVGWASPVAVGLELKAIIRNFDEAKKK